MVEAVIEDHFSTHFQSDQGSRMTYPQRIFYQKLDSEMIDLVI